MPTLPSVGSDTQSEITSVEDYLIGILPPAISHSRATRNTARDFAGVVVARPPILSDHDHESNSLPEQDGPPRAGRRTSLHGLGLALHFAR